MDDKLQRSAIKKYENLIEKLLPELKILMKKESGLIRCKATNIMDEMGECSGYDLKTVYWDLKQAFYNKGIVLGIGIHKSGEHLFSMRPIEPEDKCPSKEKRDDIDQIIITKDLTKIMDEVRSMTLKDGLERGFILFNKDDGILNPGELFVGSDNDINLNMNTITNDYIFGSFHIHPYFKESIDLVNDSWTDKEIEKYKEWTRSSASLHDIITIIKDYIFYKDYVTHSAEIILSDIDDYAICYIPRENISYEMYSKALNRYNIEKIFKPLQFEPVGDREIILLEKRYDYLFDLFFKFRFKVPLNEDIIIEFDILTKEYSLNNIH